MESIYFVMSWLCHRTCEHCYEDRFHPYYGDESNKSSPLPKPTSPASSITCLTAWSISTPATPGTQRPNHSRRRRNHARPCRERVLYPGLVQLRDKYRDQGGVELVVQTTGDI